MSPSSNRPPSLRSPGAPNPEPVAEVEEVEMTPEPDGDGAIQPNPAAVAYRTSQETCGNCTYFSDDFCSHPIVAQKVSVGDSCSAFEGASTPGEQYATEGSNFGAEEAAE